MRAMVELAISVVQARPSIDLEYQELKGWKPESLKLSALEAIIEPISPKGATSIWWGLRSCTTSVFVSELLERPSEL
jgi:hypothetical protein